MLTHSYRRSGEMTLGWSYLEWLAVAIVGLSTWTLGCSANKPAPGPVADVEPPFPTLCEQEPEVVPVEAGDLGVLPTAIVEVGRKNLEIEPSTGRFPAGISVVQIEAATRGDEPEHFLRIVAEEDFRLAYWTYLMQDLPMIREVVPLRTYGLDARGTDWRSLLQASLHIDCDLCFMYAQVHETAADAEFVGVLWDAVTEKALAAYRVPIVLPPDVRLKYEEKKKYVGSRSDAEHRAKTELRRLVRDTIWDIAAKDNEATTTQPNPWQTDYPLYPRDHNPHMRIYIRERSGR